MEAGRLSAGTILPGTKANLKSARKVDAVWLLRRFVRVVKRSATIVE